MSRLKRDRARSRLRRILSQAVDENFFALIWALDALQTGREDLAARILLRFPREAAASEIGSRYAIHRWELEALVGQLLVTEKAPIREGRNRQINCRVFATAQLVANQLRNLEEAEAAIFLDRGDVLLEMHRIAQRQFGWQRGYGNVNRIYRYARIYGQGECDRYFQEQYGLSINDFSLVGFAVYASLHRNLWLAGQSYRIDQLGVKRATFETALGRLSKPIRQARITAASMANVHGRGLPIAYQPSFLRRFPIVSFGDNNERLYAPIPDLILFRITSGLYYDLAPEKTSLIREANERFEAYVEEFMSAMMPQCDVGGSYGYGTKKHGFDSPDVIVRLEDQISLVIECKATKLTFEAQYAEDPKSAAETAYGQIAKGVFQLWRYFSHARRGIAGIGDVSPNVHGIVLTLDTWLMMAPKLQEQVIASATKMAADKDLEILAEDRRPIVFCAVEDLEYTLINGDEVSFMQSLASAGQDRFVGWVLPDIYRETQGEVEESKPYPFDVADVLPWWGMFPNNDS